MGLSHAEDEKMRGRKVCGVGFYRTRQVEFLMEEKFFFVCFEEGVVVGGECERVRRVKEIEKSEEL